MSGIVTETSATLANLNAAFERESNAHARYLAFAARAESDGWFGAASLFRTVARAEQIHAQNHAQVIQQFGGEARCHIHPVEVENTPQNLEAALAAEQHAIEMMYPAFIIEAGANWDTVTERAFTRALETAKTHAALFHETLELVAEGPDAWITSPTNFCVCPACGFTSGMMDQEAHCPVCNLSWEKLEIIR